MASGYALPTSTGSHHGYSHSYSGTHLSPHKATSNAFPNSNGSVVKKAVSNGSLFTHAESSRETSPISSPSIATNNFSPFDQNAFAFQNNARSHNHIHTKSWSPMKSSRARGESDLGRPANSKSSAYTPSLEAIPAASTSWFTLPEALTSLLIPMPYLLASVTYSSMSGLSSDEFPPLAAYAETFSTDLAGSSDPVVTAWTNLAGAVEACALASGTLVLAALAAKLTMSKRVLDRRKDLHAASLQPRVLLSLPFLYSMAMRALGLVLPFYAATQLGGMRVGLVLLVAVAANLTCSDMSMAPAVNQWRRLWSSKVATSVILLLSFISDELGLTIRTPLTNVLFGYVALAISVLVLQPPLPTLAATAAAGQSSKLPTPTSSSPPWSRNSPMTTESVASSPLICSPGDVNVTLVAGMLLACLTFLVSMLLPITYAIPASAIMLNFFTVTTMTAAIMYSEPSSLRGQGKAGLALGCLITASCSFMFSPSIWPGTVTNGGLSALSFLGVLYDTNGSQLRKRDHHDHHDHAHNAHTHHHQHQHLEGGYSPFTKFIMARCKPGSLLYEILSEKDSRRIAYFTVLNFGFMIIQGAYGYLSGSLGLLSDTVHMFFDCLGLVVGLGAAVASKWPTSPEKPYGWGKLNTLAGFGNGIFLMLVSVEFVWEAIEGIVERTELRHVQELLVVSTLGLLVNLVGLVAFGHAHAGHNHGHSHSHSHSSGHAHQHAHANGHAHSHECDHSHEAKAQPAQAHDHGHNENMHGIFLHVAADAGGSLAVIISTALTLWKPWYLWDPLATIIIAVLIFAAAVPLVTSSGQKLLLVIPDELEYNIKSMLQELGEVRGVIGYAVPRFWLDDKDASSDSDSHHGHEHASDGAKPKVMGVIHIIAAPNADVDDVQQRVEAFVADRNMNLIIHVEREADGQCWCGGVTPRSG